MLFIRKSCTSNLDNFQSNLSNSGRNILTPSDGVYNEFAVIINCNFETVFFSLFNLFPKLQIKSHFINESLPPSKL